MELQLKIRNIAVMITRFALLGIACAVATILRLFYEVADCAWTWLQGNLPRVKLSAAEEAEWDAWEQEQRDRKAMSLAEFDEAYQPGDPLHWGEVPDPSRDVWTDMKLHGVDISVDVDSFQPKKEI